MGSRTRWGEHDPNAFSSYRQGQEIFREAEAFSKKVLHEKACEDIPKSKYIFSAPWSNIQQMLIRWNLSIRSYTKTEVLP